ncbi:hypothetical protein PVAND_017530 [Polypedilum vanderplanki]|uniref:Uncharacterized protein n=1 Tax=Polypedilum vanderplanki TaxID=319348 RepID=A0A9J6BJT2_POLVA|nr:hypothetical protein PVAND_017530 [Polypedilum vanderplanki]
MLTVNKFMCQVELFVGCIIIGMLNTVFSVIFFTYTILDIYNHNSDRDGQQRSKRVAIQEENRNSLIDLFVIFKAVIFVIYFLHFVYCIYLIAAALKKSTKNVRRYLLISTLATIAAFSEGLYLIFNNGITDMALNYFAFGSWNIYFLICVYSYYDRYRERASYDGNEEYETEAMGV